MSKNAWGCSGSSPGTAVAAGSATNVPSGGVTSASPTTCVIVADMPSVESDSVSPAPSEGSLIIPLESAKASLR